MPASAGCFLGFYMSDLNEDGLKPGQEVDFNTLMKVKRGNKDASPEPKPKPKPARKAKTSATN